MCSVNPKSCLAVLALCVALPGLALGCGGNVLLGENDEQEPRDGNAGGAATGGAAIGGAATGGAATGGAATGGAATGGAGGAAGGTTGDAATPPPDGASSCDDNVRDGSETDVDCGGSCRPCALAQKCAADSDCSRVAPGCDGALGGCACNLVTGTCVVSHCADERQDSTESDVDCGGVCPGCGPQKHCGGDSDCSATVSGCAGTGCFCDAVSQTCVVSHCFDHKMDSSETAVDCGGGVCDGCTLGQGCGRDYDCQSGACDGISFTCVTDTCSDHRQDGLESDVDCGGPTCSGCPNGKRCQSSLDCAIGTCPTGVHVCQ